MSFANSRATAPWSHWSTSRCRCSSSRSEACWPTTTSSNRLDASLHFELRLRSSRRSGISPCGPSTHVHSLVGWAWRCNPSSTRCRKRLDRSSSNGDSHRLLPQPVRRSTSSAPQGVPRPEPGDRRLAGPRELLKLAVQHPTKLDTVFDELPPELFGHPAYVAVRRDHRRSRGSGVGERPLDATALERSPRRHRSVDRQRACRRTDSGRREVARSLRTRAARPRPRKGADASRSRNCARECNACETEDPAAQSEVFSQLVSLEASTSQDSRGLVRCRLRRRSCEVASTQASRCRSLTVGPSGSRTHSRLGR